MLNIVTQNSFGPLLKVYKKTIILFIKTQLTIKLGRIISTNCIRKTLRTLMHLRDTSTNSSTCYNHEDVAIDVIINNKITGSEVKKAI